MLYVTDFEEYWPGNAEQQEGHFFPVLIEKKGKKLQMVKDGVSKEVDFPEDDLLVIRLTDQKTTVKISVDSTEIVTLNFAKATLQEKG